MNMVANDAMAEWLQEYATEFSSMTVPDDLTDKQREALIQALIKGEESGRAREWTREDLYAEARRRVGLDRQD